ERTLAPFIAATQALQNDLKSQVHTYGQSPAHWTGRFVQLPGPAHPGGSAQYWSCAQSTLLKQSNALARSGSLARSGGAARSCPAAPSTAAARSPGAAASRAWCSGAPPQPATSVQAK